MFPENKTYQNTDFVYHPVHKVTLDRDDSGPYRVYRTPAGTFPSITTILDGTKPLSKKQGLAKWRENVGEEEAHRILEASKRHGEALHKHCEDYLNGKEVACQTYQEVELFTKLKPHLDKNLTGFYGTELPLFSSRMRMAGTSDLPGIWKGQNAIIDFKNSRKPKRQDWIGDYILQGIGYARMMEERYPDIGPFTKVVILVAVHGLQEAQVFELDRTPELDKKLLHRVMQFHRDNRR